MIWRGAQVVTWLLVIVSVIVTFDRQNSDAEERRDQTCRSFESDHLEEVESLRRTYRFLRELTPEERGTALERAVLRQLPENERDAASDSDTEGAVVPTFCDEPGYGLKEPDPKIPERPAALK